MKFIKNCLTSVLKYIFAGVIIWVPLGLIIALSRFVLGDIESFVRSILVTIAPDRFIYPGFGILLVIILCYLTGILLNKTRFGNFFAKIPLLGVFFRSKKGKKLSLDDLRKLTPCLFLMSPTCISCGWILSEMDVKLNEEEKAPFGLVNVYYPNVPTLLTGQIFSERKEAVIKLGNPSMQIIDLLFYAFTTPENLIYVPWEHETDEEFAERAKGFGLNVLG